MIRAGFKMYIVTYWNYYVYWYFVYINKYKTRKTNYKNSWNFIHLVLALLISFLFSRHAVLVLVSQKWFCLHH